MKVLHIITGLSNGGVEAILYRMCRAGGTDQHIVVSLLGKGKYGSLLEDMGTEVHSLHFRARPAVLLQIFRLYRIIRHVEPDVVQTWMYHANLIGGVAARAAGCAAVCWGVHNTQLASGRSRRTTLWIARVNAFISRWLPRHIIYCAYRAREVHEALGYDPRKSVVIQNGYDIDAYAPDPAARARLRSAWSIGEGRSIVGCVARADPWKDHGNLFAAIRILRDGGSSACFVLVGDGVQEENPAVRGLLDRHGIRADEGVRLLGVRSDVPALMSAFDLHVLPSAAEAFPNVLCEAMACGTPCVSTDVGDAAMIVVDTGWLVPPEDPDALAAAIRDALEEREARNDCWKTRQVAARRRIAGEFNFAKMYASYRRAWQSATV